MARYGLTKAGIKRGLDAIATSDRDVRRILAKIGYPAPRRRPHGFETLLRVIVGQQLSTKAAATIYGRLTAAMDEELTPERLLRLRRPTLRRVGLSGQKTEYVKALAKACKSGTLDIAGLPKASDEDVIRQITEVRGLGTWSARIYLMFSLGRLDVWPSGDLAVRAAQAAIKGVSDKVTPKQSEALAQSWAPHRSSGALLCWHYVNNPPS